MAVALEFINFIVPISVIQRKYPGGWQKCLADHVDLLGSVVWHDDYLFRDGAMSARDIEGAATHWRSMGFKLRTRPRGEKLQWTDACIVAVYGGGVACACDWLDIDADRQMAYLKGTEPGPVVGRTIID